MASGQLMCSSVVAYGMQVHVPPWQKCGTTSCSKICSANPVLLASGWLELLQMITALRIDRLNELLVICTRLE